jgi:ubiquinone/menaquinone biosynthesis C-methylase UbiE
MSTPQDVRTRVADTYNAAADRFDDPINSYWDRFGRRTIERLHLVSGNRVLDVCSGAGASALVAAEHVGPTGRVIGIDLADTLLQRARARAAARGLTQVEFRVGDLLEPPLDPADVFDAVVCVFGIFFVPDMNAALQALWSRVAPGGALAITSWGEDTFEPADSGFWQAVKAVRPDLYRAFIPWDRLATSDGMRGLFTSAGLPAPDIEVEHGVHPLARAEDWWTVVLGSGYRGTVDQLTEDERTRVREASTNHLRASGATALTTNVLYATLRRPVR